MLMPNALMQRLLSSGKLKIGKAEPEHVARAAPVSNPSAGKPRN
jgi:hypothetical protein